MSLPYENATSGKRALSEMHKILREFGCSTFGSMENHEKGELLVQFEYRGTPISIKASLQGYAAAWLRRNPWSDRRYLNRVEYERKAKTIAAVAVYSILRDWIKGQITAIETGILSFEGAFLGQILLPSGKTILEYVEAQKMLPAPEQKIVALK